MDFSNLKNTILSGCISGCITSISLQPLEFVKTRLQQPSTTKDTKPTIRNIIRNVLLQNPNAKGHVDVLSPSSISGSPYSQNKQYNYSNIRILWTGLTPSLMRAVPVSVIYFSKF
jgi:hypothetical protein